MKKIKFLGMLIACLTAMVAFTACGDDEDEPFDPSNPMVGTWECVSYENVDMCNDESWSWSSLNEFWEKEFKKEWLGRKITIRKDVSLEDGQLWLSYGEKHEGKLYPDDEEYLYNINVSEDGKTMTASLSDKEFLTMDGSDWIKFRGTLTFRRK